MTVRLLLDYLGQPANSLITLSAPEETQLVAAKMASTYLTGGTTYVPPNPPGNDVAARIFSDDVRADFPAAGKADTFYLDKSTGQYYRWNSATDTYVAVGDSLAAISAKKDIVQATPGTLVADWSAATIVANGTPGSGSAGLVQTDRAPTRQAVVGVRLVGDASVRASVTCPFALNGAAYAAPTAQDFKGIAFWAKVKGRTAGPMMAQLYLGATADPYTGKSLAGTLALPSDGKWHLIFMPRAGVGAQNGSVLFMPPPEFGPQNGFVIGTDTLTSIGIRDNAAGAGYPGMLTNAEELQLGPVYINPWSRSKFLIRFDDSLHDLIDPVATFTADGVTQAWSCQTLLAQYGFGSKGTMFHLTRWIGKTNPLKTFITQAQMATLAALGWSHCIQTQQDPADVQGGGNGLRLMGTTGYAAKAITSVDTTANTLTATVVHYIGTGLYEGYPVVFTGTNLPAPLVAGTVYWARYVNATDFSLFLTENDSIANTNIIDLTTTGTAANFTYRYGYSANDGSLQQADIAGAIADLTEMGYGKTARLWAPNQGAISKDIRASAIAAGVKYTLTISNNGTGFNYPRTRLMNAETVCEYDGISASHDSWVTVPSACQSDGVNTAQNMRDYVDAVIATGGIGQNYHHTLTSTNGLVLAAYLDHLRLRVAEGVCDVVTGEELMDYLDAAKTVTPGVVY